MWTASASREQEVLSYIASGMSNKSIAARLSITDGTVKVHVKHMLKKLGFRSRVEAAVWASERGFKSPDDETRQSGLSGRPPLSRLTFATRVRFA